MIDLETRPAAGRTAWGAVGLAWLASLGALAVWLVGTSTGTLREQLKLVQFWPLEAGLFLVVVLGGYALKDILRELDRTDFTRMGILAAVALCLTLFVAPRTNRIFYDEQIYQSIGQNLADLRLAQMCNDGGVRYGRLQCASSEYNKQPYAYPHLLSVAYRLFGVRPGTAFGVNALAMAAIVCGVYMLAWLLFRDTDAALFAGLVLALTPQQIIWSATAAVEPTSSLAIVAALLCATHYARAGRNAALGAAMVTAAYAIQFRPESFLVLPVLGILIWPRFGPELRRPRGWWAGLLFLALAAVPFAHLYAVRNIEWGASAARFSLHYLPGNLRVNGRFYLFDERFPMAFTLLALFGLALPGFRRERLAMAMYFALFFGIGLVFYAGSYNYGADVRYSLLNYPPLAILAGVGAARLVRLLIWRGMNVRGVLITGLAFIFLWHAPAVRATTEEAWAARADVRFAREFAAGLPPESYILTHNPGMFQLWGNSAGQLPLMVMNPHYVSFLAGRYPGGVYVHWNYWCNVQDPVHPEFCRKALALGQAELVREARERDQRFALYRITVPPSK
jgi:4-amino-4-deoxy-L-arabinose transferase-like glycosyltransferase